MGTYLNPGLLRFEMAFGSEIYVDKTGMIRYLNRVVNTTQRFVCVSRPRRFGKTMAADMLCAYYGEADSRGLFEKTELVGQKEWDRYLNRFDVIRLVMTEFIKENKAFEACLEKMQRLVVRDLKKRYPDVDYFDEDDLIQTMADVYAETGKQFVLIIDEWDAVFRERKEDKEGQRIYLDFLRNLLKDRDYIALAYMTGILPIKKYGKHSALNMFREFSVIAPMQFAPYTGFTEEEVKGLCSRYGRDYEKIKEWYDGYYEALADYIRMNLDGLKDAVALMIDGGRINIDLSTYQNDMTTFHGKDDVLTLLIHLGYLGYDADMKKVFIPNHEILDEFKTSTNSEEWVDTFHSFQKSQELLNATWGRDEDKVAELLEYFHDMAENKSYHSEAALSYTVQMAYYAAQKYYTTIQEPDSGKGYVDIVYLPAPGYPDKPALLIELKYNKTAGTALHQIKDRNYPQRLEHYKDNLLLVGINYDREISNTGAGYKRHVCRIEKAHIDG